MTDQNQSPPGRANAWPATANTLAWVLAVIALVFTLGGNAQAAERNPAGLIPALLGNDGLVDQLLGAGGILPQTLTNLGLIDPIAISGVDNAALIAVAEPSQGLVGSLLATVGSLVSSLLGNVPIVDSLLLPPPPPILAMLPAAPVAAIGDLDGDGDSENGGTRFGRYLTQIDPDVAFQSDAVSLDSYTELPPDLP